MTKAIPYITEDQARAVNSLIGKITKEIKAEKGKNQQNKDGAG